MAGETSHSGHFIMRCPWPFSHSPIQLRLYRILAHICSINQSIYHVEMYIHIPRMSQPLKLMLNMRKTVFYA